MNIGVLLLFLLIGITLGYTKFLPNRVYQINEYVINAGLVILLMSMGAKIGIDEEIMSNIHRIGFQALIIAIGAVMGSIVIVKILVELSRFDLATGSTKDLGDSGGADRGMMALIMGSVIIGIILGIIVIPNNFIGHINNVTTISLAILLLGVGVDIGLNKEALIKAKDLGIRIFLIPIGVVFGSIFGAIISGYLLNMVLVESGAVGAGFGWYSLSSVLITEIHGVELGSMAFLSNVFRELIAILTIPVVSKYFGRFTCIAPGGATAMDVTLPIIKKSAGEEAVIPAFISGAVLSALVPVLVPFILGL